ncbi:hypothetical protein [Escherichia coli]|uniref:F4 family fimbrial subunit n=1 Tax=Escherichia coli TaxID=562 RepID=UPI000BE1BCE7|nr:hypothetical protein [Escherichia coli]
MKKTLIALTVAASAVVSGSAMAAGWERSGIGGSVDLGGTLTPESVNTPWEVKVGDMVNGLDANVHKDDKEVSIILKNAIPFLGIRTDSSRVFQGRSGISPQINFNGAINNKEFSEGMAKLRLDIHDKESRKIGMLSTSMYAGAEYSYKKKGKTVLDLDKAGKTYMTASQPGDAFYGGLGISKNAVYYDPWTRVRGISTEYTENYTAQGGAQDDNIPNNNPLNDEHSVFSAYYGAGLEQGRKIEIKLEQPVSSAEPVLWKASLPITVSYQ